MPKRFHLAFAADEAGQAPARRARYITVSTLKYLTAPLTKWPMSNNWVTIRAVLSAQKAVAAAHDPVDFQHRIQLISVIRIGRKPYHARSERHRHIA